MRGQKKPIPPKKVSEQDIDATIKDVENKLLTEDQSQQRHFEHKIKWAMEDE